MKVVKEHREKTTVQNGIEENGVVSANIEKEVGKQIMQYQVRAQNKQKTTNVQFEIALCLVYYDFPLFTRLLPLAR